MKKLLIFILSLSISTSLWAAAPTRQSTYTAQTTIRSADVTGNENAIFNYLQAGVDTYADGTIENADISSSAAISYSKLSLTSGIVNADINSSAGIVASKLDLTSPGAIGSTAQNTGNFTNVGIGTASTQTKLSVMGGNVGIGTVTATGGRLIVQGGNVGIGTVNANTALTVAGTIYSTTGGIRFPDNTSQTTAASYTSIAGSYAAGTYLIAGPGGWGGNNNTTTPTKISEVYVPRGGTLTIKFFLIDSVSMANNAIGRIYRNGSAVGTAQVQTGGTATEYSENISGWSAGDLCQLYVYNDGGTTVSTGGDLRLYENLPVKEVFSTPAEPMRHSGVGVPPNPLGSQGDIYLRTDGGASTTLYVKTGASTWTAK